MEVLNFRPQLRRVGHTRRFPYREHVDQGREVQRTIHRGRFFLPRPNSPAVAANCHYNYPGRVKNPGKPTAVCRLRQIRLRLLIAGVNSACSEGESEHEAPHSYLPLVHGHRGKSVNRTRLRSGSGEILDHYRILPRHSTLQQTGGIAGFDLKYRLIGKYDLLHGVGWNSRAKFENAEIWGSQISDHPVPAIVIDVDEILNLERLHGEALPVGAPFDVYQFKGNTSDGSSVNLLGAVIGPWMYLRGGTQPPEGSADYFTYRIHALARSKPFADFNGDGRVDGADYVLHRKAADAGNAAALDDVTAGAGFAEWRQQFGETVPDLTAMDMMLSAAMGSSAAVPEPASWALVFFSSVMLANRGRRRK